MNIELFKELLDDPVIRQRLEELIKKKDEQTNIDNKIKDKSLKYVKLELPKEIRWEEICDMVYVFSHREQDFSLIKRILENNQKLPLVYRCKQRGLFNYWIKEKRKYQNKKYAILLLSFTYPDFEYEFDNQEQDRWDGDLFKGWSNEDCQIALIIDIDKSEKSEEPTKFLKFKHNSMLLEKEWEESKSSEEYWKTAFVFVGVYNFIDNPIKLSKIKFWDLKLNKVSEIYAKISRNVRGGRFCRLSENQFVIDTLKNCNTTYGIIPK